jgi:voltage-gated potassium channel
MPRKDRFTALRRQAYDVLEHDQLASPWAVVVARAIVVLIIVNLVTMSLASVPEIEASYGTLFSVIEWISLLVFTVEYILRVWTAIEHVPYRHFTPLRRRMKYAASGMGIIDLLAVLPFWLEPLYPAGVRALVVFGILRFFKMVRYSPAMRSLLTALYNERRSLLGSLVILLGATLLFASLMHLIEHNAQPDKFGTIPDAIWWAIVTLCTVGYGDVVPVTAAGKVVAGLAIILGLMMIALPVAVIASAFAEEVKRRDFIVTWGMVARVPLFADLGASDIADILRLLRAQVCEAGRIIVRRGEPATCMYFIAAGEVEVELPRERVKLGVGQFFGEIALLRRSNRSATVMSVTRTNLLALDAHDFHSLMEREPRIAAHINEVARSRVGTERITPKGDIIADELAAGEIDKDLPEAD